MNFDYAQSGMTIQSALLDSRKRFGPFHSLPPRIMWGGRYIGTADWFKVPKKGRVFAEFISCNQDVEQGFDMRLKKGWLELAEGERIKHLRTWYDLNLSMDVEYPYSAPDGIIAIWNVYKHRWSDDRILDEYWTENAGLWVEEVSEFERIYHCSYAFTYPPDFESLVFRVQIL